MEKWAMKKSQNLNWDKKDSQKKGCNGGLLNGLRDEFKGLLENGVNEKLRKRNREMGIDCKHIEKSDSKFNRLKKRLKESRHDDDIENHTCDVLSNDSVSVVSVSSEEGMEVSSEQQESLPNMLNWLTSVARSPHDPSIGVLPHWSKWKEYTGNEYWIQVTRARKALLVKRENAESRYQNSPSLGHQTMHPSMYEDIRKPTGTLRCSIRHLQVPKTQSCLCCSGTRSSNDKALIIFCKAKENENPVVETMEAIESSKEGNLRHHVRVGSLFQVEVDEWTEPISDSDTKWLGTRTWPLKPEETQDKLKDDLIGKGRSNDCRCDYQSGSVECIRFHIAESRFELKQELGEVFFLWRFNQMGEEVSLKWTEREEKKFKEMMMLKPEQFWENAKKCFRLKTRKQLVSYYFNVFLINKRRYQNRVTPRNVDSSDEACVFGCVGHSFGRDAVISVGSEIMICSQNRQCVEVD